jgi:hypothetical protein
MQKGAGLNPLDGRDCQSSESSSSLWPSRLDVTVAEWEKKGGKRGGEKRKSFPGEVGGEDV